MGVHNRAIVKAIDKGQIKEGVHVNEAGHRKIIFDIAFKEWNESRDPMQDHARENGKVEKKKTEKRGGGESASSTLTDVKLEKEKIALESAQIELKKKRGELVDVQKVYKVLFEYGKGIRDELLQLPDRLIDEIRGADTRNEAHIIFTKGMEAALRGLADSDKLKFSDNEK